MKKIFLCLLMSATFISSCKKEFLDENPRGGLTSEGFFKTNANLELALTAMYTRCNNAYNIDEFDVPLMGSDDVTTRTNSNKQDFLDFDLFGPVNTNERLLYAWQNNYRLISAANFVLNGYNEATAATELQRNQAAGQAYFCRAFAYLYIVRVWGKAPIVTKNVADYTIKRSTPLQIYELIIADLKIAETLLPVSWASDPLKKYTAPTIGAAKSLLAATYLQMTGFPINDVSKYELAASKAKEVLDNASSYGYSLLPNFADLWRDRVWNNEIIFGMVYNNASSSGAFADLNVRAPYPSQPEDEGGWDDYFAEINFFNAFPAGPRKDATFQTTFKPNATTTIDWTEGKLKHPYYKKMRAANGEQNLVTPWVFFNWMSSRTNIAIRFAEVKLIYAEANAMAGSPDASAYKEVNDVRKRAGLADLPAGLSKTDFRDAVVQERAWEFAGNEICHRWYDLVRLERVESANANRHPNELPFRNQPSKRDYFAPIPITELRLNPNLAE